MGFQAKRTPMVLVLVGFCCFNSLNVAAPIAVILGLKVHLAFGKTLEADLAEVLVRSVAIPRALLTLAFRSLSHGFAS